MQNLYTEVTGIEMNFFFSRGDIIFLQPVTMLKQKDDAKAIIRFLYAS